MIASRRSGAGLALLAGVLVATAGVGVAWAAWTDGTRLQGTATAGFLAPQVVRVPHVTGTPVDQETLTAVEATWSGLSPSATRTRQWFSCTSTLSSCTPIAGATGTVYVVPAGSVTAGTRFVVRQRVTNGPHQTDATSVATDPQTSGSVVLGILVRYVLVATTPPAVSAPATLVPGTSVSVTSGTWTGRSLLGEGLNLGTRTYAYRWLRCGPIGHSGSPTPTAAPCVNATGAGATTATYVPNAADVGHRLRVRVSASAAQALGTTATGRITTQATAVVASP